MNTESEAADAEGSLSLDAGDNEEFAALQAGQRACISVWGNVESNKDGALALAVDKASVMPSDYAEEEGGDEGDQSAEADTEEQDLGEPSPVAAVSRKTVKPPGAALPKSVITTMVGRPRA